MKLHYAAAGPKDDPPLLLLHGVTRRWQSFLPVIPTLETRWRVLAMDLPGHGGSGRLDRGYKVVDYIPPLVEFLKQHIKKPAVIYGHSLGSMLAAALAAALPDRVRAVILEDPPFETMGLRIAKTPLHDWFTALSPFAASELPVAELARQISDAKAGTELIRQLRDPVAIRFTAASLRRLDPEVLEPILAGQWMVGYDVETILKGVRCPALLLQADPALGGMLTDADAARAELLMNDCTLMRVDGAPHLIHWAQTPTLLRLVQGFLASLE